MAGRLHAAQHASISRRESVRAAADDDPAGIPDRGMRRFRRSTTMGLRPVVGRTTPADMRLDPDTHAFVLGTAFFTSLTFALGMWLPALVVFRWLLAG